jgi:predicted ATPase
VLGVIAFWLSKFLQSKEHLERAIAAYDVQWQSVHIALYSQDPGMVCQIRLALTLWHLGYAEQARQQATEALALARQLAHPWTLGYVLVFAAWLANDRRDDAATARLAAEAIALSRQHGLTVNLPIALILQGWLLTKQGEIEAGIAQMRDAMKHYQRSGHDLHRPYALVVIAQAYIHVGANDAAMVALDEGLATVAHHGDLCYEAELHRLKGELYQTLDGAASVVEASFRRAYTIACQQQAKSLELRAALSLSRLWKRQGKREQARQVLAESYGWFTEGFDTADLQEARALLAELS